MCFIVDTLYHHVFKFANLFSCNANFLLLCPLCVLSCAVWFSMQFGLVFFILHVSTLSLNLWNTVRVSGSANSFGCFQQESHGPVIHLGQKQKDSLFLIHVLVMSSLLVVGACVKLDKIKCQPSSHGKSSPRPPKG